MENLTKWAARFASAVFTGLKLAVLVAVVVGLISFLGAPSFFGIVFITAGIIATVVAYTVVGFVVGFIAKLLRVSGVFARKEQAINLGTNTPS
jgi:hypothetical protein